MSNWPRRVLRATNAFGYDTASCLLTLTDGTNSATYVYLSRAETTEH